MPRNLTVASVYPMMRCCCPFATSTDSVVPFHVRLHLCAVIIASLPKQLMDAPLSRSPRMSMPLMETDAYGRASVPSTAASICANAASRVTILVSLIVRQYSAGFRRCLLISADNSLTCAVVLLDPMEGLGIGYGIGVVFSSNMLFTAWLV